MEKFRKKQTKKIGLLAAVCVFSIILVFSFSSGLFEDIFNAEQAGTAVQAEMSLHVIDVGQGDSILAVCKDSAVLFDAGKNNQGETVVKYLKKYGIKKLDFVVVTHPHEDHIGGMDTVLQNIKAENLIMPRIPSGILPTTKTYEDFLNVLREKSIKPIAAAPGKTYMAGDMKIEVLAPVKTYGDLNNMSVVVKLTYKDTSFLLSGDAEKEAETDILSSGANLKADVYKVGHHGSGTSSSEEFLKAVSPKYAAISAGKNNGYGHPAGSTLKRLESAGVEYFITMNSGTIVFESDGSKITVKTEK